MNFKIDFKNSYAALPNNFYARLNPEPVKQPVLIKINNKLAEDLGIDTNNIEASILEEIFSGNKILSNSDPIAMTYAGHQFGHWVPQLGDGRAILLGEIIAKDGLRKDIQLKGSGKTPFSRMGDGRAWLGPVIREYILSEAMNALSVPTTRALSIIKTGENIIREKIYPGAILARVANSHIRVGTFQYFASRKDIKSLKILTDYVLDRHYPNLLKDKNKYLKFLENVALKQAYLVAKWMSLGFIHGVMNTDNTSITGETIDYGPCAFMDNFNYNQVFSSIDHMGRYSYKNQPEIMKWNLACLATCLLPLINEDENKALSEAQKVIDSISDTYENFWLKNFRAKFGLHKSFTKDKDLINDFLSLMEKHNLDFTLSFQGLAKINNEGSLLKNYDDFNRWKLKYYDRLNQENIILAERIKTIKFANPVYIPRNHVIEKIITESLENDFARFHAFNKCLSNPFEENKEYTEFSKAPLDNEKVLETFCGT